MRQNVFAEIPLATIPHPPYSLDLAPSDFWLFGHIKTSLADRVFSHINKFLEAVIPFLTEIHPSELQLVFHHRIERVK
jgi:hypothetical protein